VWTDVSEECAIAQKANTFNRRENLRPRAFDLPEEAMLHERSQVGTLRWDLSPIHVRMRQSMTKTDVTGTVTVELATVL
jgi:hypothetical protein